MKSTTFKVSLGLIILLGSCKTPQLFVSEMNGDPNDLLASDSLYHHIIQPDDKVSLSIWNHDDMSVGSVFSIYNSNEAYGKWVLVDAEGEVILPRIGKVKLSGLNCTAAADTLRSRFQDLIVDPIIVVKVLNREVTILGEVRTPGTYILEKERNTISELIGKAQGFDTYADLERIQIIRKNVSYIIDMTILNESSYHKIVICSGDVINVLSKKGKKLDQKAPTIIPFASALTAIAVVVSIILN